MRTLLPLLLGCALVAGCANSRTGTHTAPLPGEAAIGLSRGETLPPFSPAETASENWSRAEKAFEEEAYLVAGRYYVYIRRKFPYSRYAVLSDLRLADVQFQRERWLEAIDSYKNFARLHPTHAQVPYSLFRIGQSQYELMPSDWFFLPPSHEKDQTMIADASKAFDDYLGRFPEDKNADKARELRREIRKRLLKHEEYVANFYRKTGRLSSYLSRLTTIYDQYADVADNESVLLDLVKAYAKAENRTKAQGYLDELKNKFPEAKATVQAKRLVAQIPEPEPEEKSEEDNEES